MEWVFVFAFFMLMFMHVVTHFCGFGVGYWTGHQRQQVMSIRGWAEMLDRLHENPSLLYKKNTDFDPEMWRLMADAFQAPDQPGVTERVVLAMSKRDEKRRKRKEAAS